MDTIFLFYWCKWSPSVDYYIVFPFLMIQHNLTILSFMENYFADPLAMVRGPLGVWEPHFENHWSKSYLEMASHSSLWQVVIGLLKLAKPRFDQHHVERPARPVLRTARRAPDFWGQCLSRRKQKDEVLLSPFRICLKLGLMGYYFETSMIIWIFWLVTVIE